MKIRKEEAANADASASPPEMPIVVDEKIVEDVLGVCALLFIYIQIISLQIYIYSLPHMKMF